MNQDNIEALERAKANSIGNTKKDKLIIKTKKISKQVVTFLIALVIILGTCACGNYNKGKNEGAQYINYNYVELYTYEQTSYLEDLFTTNGLSYHFAYNSVEDYQSIIEHLSEDDMIIYYEQLGLAETNKICQALGYENLNNYLEKKGYVNEEGNPSISVLKDVAYKNITEEMAGRTR